MVGRGSRPLDNSLSFVKFLPSLWDINWIGYGFYCFASLASPIHGMLRWFCWESCQSCVVEQTRVEFCLLHHGVLRGKFRWNLQLHLPPRVEFTPCFLAGNTMKCRSKPVVFPYFTTRKYHPSGILGTTRRFASLLNRKEGQTEIFRYSVMTIESWNHTQPLSITHVRL
jgi:hypothetical protein